MNNKIKNYVEVLFTDVPGSKKAKELKEELLSNMTERFDDYIAQGKTENQAYSLVVSNIGDIDEMLEEVMPNADFLKTAQTYRQRNAKNTAIGVALYIIGAVFLIGFSSFGEFRGNNEFYSIVGLLTLLMLSAVATALIIYTYMSTPPEFKDYDEQSLRERKLYASKSGTVFESVISIYWMFITFIYLGISFLTMQWQITWLIWILAGVFAQIIKTGYEMRYSDE